MSVSEQRLSANAVSNWTATQGWGRRLCSVIGARVCFGSIRGRARTLSVDGRLGSAAVIHPRQRTAPQNWLSQFAEGCCGKMRGDQEGVRGFQGLSLWRTADSHRTLERRLYSYELDS